MADIDLPPPRPRARTQDTITTHWASERRGSEFLHALGELGERRETRQLG